MLTSAVDSKIERRDGLSSKNGIPLAPFLMHWTSMWRTHGRLPASRVATDLSSDGGFNSLLDLLPGCENESPAILESDERRGPMTYARLQVFLRDEIRLDRFNLNPGDVCALALSEGPECACALLGLITHCVAFPLNPWAPPGEIKKDLRVARAKSIVIQEGESFDSIRAAARECGVRIINLTANSHQVGGFQLHSQDPADHVRKPVFASGGEFAKRNGPDDLALILFTSGTSGSKKIVPMRMLDLCAGAACLGAALELGPNDCGYNMMPLFHVGGIVRNVLAPLLAGSKMIYSRGFDASIFWDELRRRDQTVSWYYASPTMHLSILREGLARPGERSKLRFICNAAGSLPPEIAEKLRECFNACILPGYGMTECMPIACPPLDYDLDRPGASGRVLGPEVAIQDEHGAPLPNGRQGRIMIRGCPVAGRKSASEWFDTGDLGFFDDGAYLYVTGREKEVIKRGGETIAPAEIEAALIKHPDIREAVVFAIPHHTFQEVIGAVIVPSSQRRVDISGLSQHLSQDLHSSKFPVALVYMDEVPKTPTKKPIRIGLASRFGITDIDVRSSARLRIFEAECPVSGTDRSSPIPVRPIRVEPERVEAALRALGHESVVEFDGESRSIRAVVEGFEVDVEKLRARLRDSLDDYLVPDVISVVDQIPRVAGVVDRHALQAQINEPTQNAVDEVEKFLVEEWRREFGRERAIGLDSDFFDEFGGDSLTAVSLVAKTRKHFSIDLPPTVLFKERTIVNLAHVVRGAIERGRRPPVISRSEEIDSFGSHPRSHPSQPNHSSHSSDSRHPKAEDQSSWRAMAVQAIPAVFFSPILRMTQFATWIFSLWYLRMHCAIPHLWVLFASIAVAQGMLQVFVPLAAITLKWVLAARFRPGESALWGSRYLRWWLTRQALNAAGLGVFAASYGMTALYYRLLGARVGRGTKIDPEADLGEFDLLTIGDGVIIEDSAIVRPFSLANGCMALKPISVGDESTIGIRATVTPGSVIPPRSNLAPLSVSTDADGWNSDTGKLCRGSVLSPPAILQLFGVLIKSSLLLISWIPVLLVTYHWVLAPLSWPAVVNSPLDLLAWLLRPERLLFYFCLHVAYVVLSPFIYLLGVIAVKWTVIGRFKAGPLDNSKPWPIFERWLMWQLLPTGKFANVATILGVNFGAISLLYRLLGAKVGKRVYWPGSGNLLIEYDLFSCGDDVTFGSRSSFLMSSTEGSKPIRIEDGANVSDRCVLSPGVTVERNAVLGSGTFAPENFIAPAGSTWIGGGLHGPLCLEGANIRKTQQPTLRPYGLAMFERSATYWVWPLGLHIVFNFTWLAFSNAYRAAPFVLAQILTQLSLHGLGRDWDTAPCFILVLGAVYLVTHLEFALGALGVTVATKWLIVSRRTIGKHLWNESSYCQRWKIHCMISTIRTLWIGGCDLLSFLEGSIFIVWYFRALGAKIGQNVCLYPNGADPMMEEPDLVKIDDNACIDQAVLIAHLNTRGEWELGPIDIGRAACLNSMSRVMIFGKVAEGSTLRERTLVLAGDSSQIQSTWSGWPGQADSSDTLAVSQRVA